MQFLADENFPGDAVIALRERGHDVAWVRADAPGSSDDEVLARAVRECRVLLTFDKDFGELAWRAGLSAPAGIVLFCLPMPAPSDVTAIVVGILDARRDWGGQFSVVEPGRIRMRSLPSRQGAGLTDA